MFERVELMDGATWMPPLVLILAYDPAEPAWIVRIKGYPPYMVFRFNRIDTLVQLMDAAKDASPVRYELATPTFAPHPAALEELVSSGISQAMGPTQ